MNSGGIEHVGIYLYQLLDLQLLFRGYLRSTISFSNILISYNIITVTKLYISLCTLCMQPTFS